MVNYAGNGSGSVSWRHDSRINPAPRSSRLTSLFDRVIQSLGDPTFGHHALVRYLLVPVQADVQDRRDPDACASRA